MVIFFHETHNNNGDAFVLENKVLIAHTWIIVILVLNDWKLLYPFYFINTVVCRNYFENNSLKIYKTNTVHDSITGTIFKC